LELQFSNIEKGSTSQENDPAPSRYQKAGYGPVKARHIILLVCIYELYASSMCDSSIFHV